MSVSKMVPSSEDNKEASTGKRNTPESSEQSGETKWKRMKNEEPANSDPHEESASGQFEGIEGNDEKIVPNEKEEGEQIGNAVPFDPFSQDFPGFDDDEERAEGVPESADANEEGTTPASAEKKQSDENVPDPFSVEDQGFEFPELEAVVADADKEMDTGDSIELVESVAANNEQMTGGDTEQEKEEKEQDFSAAVQEIADSGLYEDEDGAISIASSDDEDAGKMEIAQPQQVPVPYALNAYPTQPMNGATIDITGEFPVQVQSMQGYNMYEQPGYGQNMYGQGMYDQSTYGPYANNYYSSFYRATPLTDKPLTKESLEELMKKNNMTADATQEQDTPILLKCRLMPHQKRALRWMRRRELKDSSIRGGILADDQGLGKTLSAIALMISTTPKPIPMDDNDLAYDDYDNYCYDIPADPSHESDDEDDAGGSAKDKKRKAMGYVNDGMEDDSEEEREDAEGEDPRLADFKNRRRAPWRTLIVCPVSLVHQWREELMKYVRREYDVQIYIYHGKNKTQDIDELKVYDVVITTYATLAMQYPKILKKDPRYEAAKEAKEELPRREPGAMYKMKWFRVILDEAQNVKNRQTENFQAVHELDAYRRWCLTGTPIQNGVDDLYSLFLFIRYKLVANYKEWQRVWKKKLESPYATTRERAFKRFQAVVGVVLLRRTKQDKIDDKPLITLPDRVVELKELDFKDNAELSFYKSVQVRSLVTMNKYLANGTLSSNYSGVLLLLLRLRQAATHPCLTLSTERKYDLSHTMDEPVKQAILQAVRKYYNDAIVDVFTSQIPPLCSSCQSYAEQPQSIILPCGHVFCSECIIAPVSACQDCQVPTGGWQSTLETVYNDISINVEKMEKILRANPGAARQLGIDEEILHDDTMKKKEDVRVKKEDKFESTGEGNSTSPDSADTKKSKQARKTKKEEALNASSGKNGKYPSSTKLETLLGELHSIRQQDAAEKSLVFSQWTSMLNIIESSLKTQGFRTCRLDGSMGMSARRDQIERFKTCQKHTVMLISLHAGGTGLNLTVARNVFLMDVWWNPAVEEQAIDRIHRIGQKSNVRVVRMKMKNTVEERIYDLCAKKRETMEGALGAEGSQSLGRKKLTMKELMYLFEGAADDVLNASSGQGEGASGPRAASSEAAQAAANILAFARDGS